MNSSNKRHYGDMSKQKLTSVLEQKYKIFSFFDTEAIYSLMLNK